MSIHIEIAFVRLSRVQEAYELGIRVGSPPSGGVIFETVEEFHEYLLDFLSSALVRQTLLGHGAVGRVLINHVDDKVLVKTDVRVISRTIDLRGMRVHSVVEDVEYHFLEIRPLYQSHFLHRFHILN